MAEAAKSARGAFTDIKSGSEEMGRSVGASAGSARQGVMLLGDEFGIHLPRGLTMFIASLGPVGPAMEAAFPFIAIILGATLLLEHLAKMRAEGVKLTQDQVQFGTAVQNAFNTLDNKLLQAGIRSDELRNDHLGALAKQLELIDHESLAELAQSFGVVAKAADVVMKDLEGHWYTFGQGSAGAKHALEEFQAKYESLLAQGKAGEAADLLAGTRRSAQQILDLQTAAAATPKKGAGGLDFAAEVAKEQAVVALQRMGKDYDKDAIAAQHALLDALNAQVTIEGKVAELKKVDSANASRTTAGATSAESASAAKAAADSQARINQQVLAADRATADARLTVQRASIESRLASDLAFSDREMQLQLAANAAQINALDKLSKEYPNAVKALHEKAAEIKQEALTREAELTAKANVAEAAKSLQDLEQSERDKIEATRQGSEERLAVIGAAIREEESLGLQDTSFFRDLMTQRAENTRRAAEEEAKLNSAAGMEKAASDLKTNELALAAQREHIQAMDAAIRISAAARLEQDINLANAEMAIKKTFLSQEKDALNKGEQDYNNKLKALQDQEQQLVKENENQIAAIKDKAQKEQDDKLKSAMTQLKDATASGLTQVLMGHKSFASQMDSVGNQIVSGMLKTALMSMMTADMAREKEAASAARTMYLAGTKFPFPANIVAAPVMGAAAFAAMMAFQDGTDSVPGYGRGDKVPAMLEPGEGVVPGGVMDNLRKMSLSGEMGGNHYHVRAHFAPTVHALDADGVDTVLDKHADKFQKHFENAVRRMNR